MSHIVQDALVEALEGDGCSMKEFLANCLSSSEKEVLDESVFKRKRGRPKKGKEPELPAMPKEKFARAAMLEEKKRQARLRDRLTPVSSEDERKTIALNADLREIGWDLEECPGKDSEFREMEAEIEVLRKEAGEAGGDLKESEEFETACKRYKELKDDIISYYGKAKECLEKKDFRRTEEYVSYLKSKPKELADRFGAAEKKFDVLCSALCALAEDSKDVRGIGRPDAFEVEKTGFGMMQGEDYSAYSKRMKSLGMGRDIPDTIKDIDRIVEAAERRWKSVAGISQETFDRVKYNWQKTIRRLLKNGFVGSNLKISGLNGLFERGLDFGDYDVGHGVMQPMMPYVVKHVFGSQYGDIIVKWKPYCVVGTILFDDGLAVGRNGQNYICPSFLTNPSPCSFGPEDRKLVKALENEEVSSDVSSLCGMANVPYCEIQLHGDNARYGAEAIESIIFSSEYEVCNLSVEALAAIAENGISLFVRGVPISIVDGKIVKEETDSKKEAK